MYKRRICRPCVASIIFVAISISRCCVASMMELVKFDEVDKFLEESTSYPRCIDGSSAGYYVDSSRNLSTSDKWIVWMEGGGICQSLKDCEARSISALGSSKFWPQTRKTTRGLLDTDKEINPDFANFNHIYVPYCSGDVWTGRKAEAINPFDTSSTWSGYFQGHTILNEVLESITNDLGAISELILTGCSAGGIGTFGNCDYVASKFPSARVTCRPEAGYFGLPIMTYDEFKNGESPSDGDLHKWDAVNWTDNIDPHIDDQPAYRECVEKAVFSANDHCSNRTLCCRNVPYLYSFIKTPIFVSENTVDSYQVFTQNGCPYIPTKETEAYVDYLHGILAGSLYDVVVNGANKDQNGLFAPACLEHCMQWQGNEAASVQGKTLQAAFGDWYFGRGNESHMQINNSTDLSQLRGCGSARAISHAK